MLTQSYKVLVILLCVLFAGCTTDALVKSSDGQKSGSPETQYRIELVNVAKQLRVGRAKFQVYVRDSEEWLPAAFMPVKAVFVGRELEIEHGEGLQTNALGQVEFDVRFKDPLKYFRWVKPSSYPVVASYRPDIQDVLPQFPYQNEGLGWSKADIDKNYLIKIQVSETLYWLPIPYKDIRPVVRQLTGLAHARKTASVTLQLKDESNSEVNGVDVFLTGKSPEASELLQDVFTSSAAVEYASRVFPDYVQGRAGGYDQTQYSVYPGDYILDVYRDGKAVLSTEIRFDYEADVTREIQIAQ